MTGGLSRPSAYVAFLRQYFSDEVIDAYGGEGTWLDFENDQVYWYPSAYSVVNEDIAVVKYDLIEFAEKRVVCRMTLSVEGYEDDFSETFDYVYEKENDRWLFTAFKTKKEIMRQHMETGDSISSALQEPDAMDGPETDSAAEVARNGVAICFTVLTVILIIVFSAKKKRTFKALLFVLALCMTVLTMSSCNRPVSDNNYPSDTATDNATDTAPEGSSDTSNATSTVSATEIVSPAPTSIPMGELISSGDWKYVISESKETGKISAVLREYTGSETELNIPGEIGGICVSELSANAFSGNENAGKILSVILPDNITIRLNAFAPLNNLEKMTVPRVESFEEMCKRYFGEENNDRLKSLIVTEQTDIPAECFKRAGSLKSVTYLKKIINIGNSAFSWCTELEEVNIESERISDNSFEGCQKLKSAPLNNVMSIGKNAFAGCTSIPEITLTNTLESIDEYAFEGCTGIKKITCETNKLTVSKRKGLGSMSSLNEVCFSDEVTEIPAYFLYESQVNSDLTIRGSGITGIGSYAFAGNWNMRVIELPSTLVDIGEYAFYYCMSLEEIKLPNGIKAVGDYAFSQCCSLTEFSLPDTFETLGKGVLSFCDRLTSVYLPESMTDVPDRTFYGCADLKEFSHRCSSIGDKAFWFCTSLNTIELGEDFEIEPNVFRYCFALFPDYSFRLDV